MERDEHAPSLAQAERLKELCTKDKLDYSTIDTVMSEKKTIQAKIIINNEKIARFFPTDVTLKEIEETIIKLLEAWHKKKSFEKNYTR